MVRLTTPPSEKGLKAEDFQLISVDGNFYNLNNVKGLKGLVIAFICNHCPYVKAISKKIAFEAEELKKINIGFVAISSNDVETYPEDSLDNMKIFSQENKFNFPYCYDPTQEVAKTYGAVCTPEFFGFNKDLILQYRGRLDSSGKENIIADKRELWLAMQQIAQEGKFTGEEIPSIGCSLKWKS